MVKLEGRVSVKRLYGQIYRVPSAAGGGPLQAKTAYPKHSEQIIIPDEDYYGLVSVTVKPTPRLPACEIKVVPVPNSPCYLNHKQLAEIPAEALVDYPYALLLESISGTMWLWTSNENPYVYTNADGIDKLSITGNCLAYYWESTAKAWWINSSYDTFTYSINGASNWAVWWSNFDIPNGSSESTEIYFPASEPKEEQATESTYFYYNGVRLPKIPEDVLTQYPYALVYKHSNGSDRLIVCTHSVYWYPTSDYPTCVKSDGNAKAYKLSTDASAWEFLQDNNPLYIITPEILWANHDIPSGSATATEIYHYGTLAVPDPIE